MNIYERMINLKLFAINNEGSGGGVEDAVIPGIDEVVGDQVDDNVDTGNEDAEEAPGEGEKDANEQVNAEQSLEQSVPERKADRTDIGKQVEPTRIPAQRRVDYDYDQKGNVINPRDGKIIYAAGSEANLLFRNLQDQRFKTSKLQQERENVIKEGKVLAAKFEAMREANTMGERLGLTVNDQIEAQTMAANYKKDPVNTLRYMLTEAVKDGIDLKQVLNDVDGINTNAIKSIINEKLEPLLSKEKAAKEQQDRISSVEQEVAKEWEGLTERFPYAELHTDQLAFIINKATEEGTYLSISDAFLRLNEFAINNGLDIRRPLKAQLETPREKVPNVQRKSALPSSVRKVFNAQTNEGGNQFDKSTKDIVAEALRENGYTLPN